MDEILKKLEEIKDIVNQHSRAIKQLVERTNRALERVTSLETSIKNLEARNAAKDLKEKTSSSNDNSFGNFFDDLLNGKKK